MFVFVFFFFQAEDGIRDKLVTGVQTCALPILPGEDTLLAGTTGLLDERVLAWHRAAALLRLASKVYVVERRKENWLDRAHALLTEATRLADLAARPDPVARVEAPALRLNGAALELILRALSTRPATPEELDQIRKLLDERKQRDQNA